MSQKLYQGSKVRKLDKIIAEQLKIPSYELMNRAGWAAFDFIRQRWPLAKKFAIVCGTGNNGGDGFVLARLLHEDNFEVEVYLVCDQKTKLSETAELAFQDYSSLNLPIISPLPDRLEHVDLIVDALLGTGLRAPLKPEWSQAIGIMNSSERPILSIDLPSGIDADSGAIIEQAVHATATITFVGAKYALLSGPALNYSGEVIFDNLGLPNEVYEQVAFDGEIIDLQRALSSLKPRSKASHKGHFGHVVIVGAGCVGLSGAVGLSALGALSGGAGLVSAIVHQGALPLMARAPLELMCHPSDEAKGVWQRATHFVVGPGLGQSGWAKEQFNQVLNKNKPLVVDADALALLAENPHKRDDWVLTPHPGEAAKLLGISSKVVEADRAWAVKEIQTKFGGIAVLKGAGTLVQGPNSHFYLNTAGNPGMASGGMGDILSGLIGSLLAQGLKPLEAAKLAVIVHAQAADIEQAMGERGMLATDLLLHIRSLLNPATDHEQKSTYIPQIFNL